MLLLGTSTILCQNYYCNILLSLTNYMGYGHRWIYAHAFKTHTKHYKVKRINAFSRIVDILI